MEINKKLVGEVNIRYKFDGKFSRIFFVIEGIIKEKVSVLIY